MLEQIQETANLIRSKGITAPQVGIILGTGLGGLINEIAIEVEIPYSEIPSFPEATVEFHTGRLIYGKLSGTQVLAMQGRFHYYEGYSMQEISFPVRVMKELGVAQLLISNAAGNMNMSFAKGDLMLIKDHINLFPSNPLIGPNVDEQGPRFPDMSAPYNPELNAQLLEIANEMGITLHHGTYVSVMGPNLETAAEYRFLRTVGADAVGMSTVPEVIVANHVGLPCAAVSVLTDDCDPDNLQPVDIQDIIATAGKAEVSLTALFAALVGRLSAS